MAGRVGNRGKRGQTAGRGWGRMGTEGIPVGPGEVRGNDLTRAAWGSRLDPMDLVWRRERHNFERNDGLRKKLPMADLSMKLSFSLLM